LKLSRWLRALILALSFPSLTWGGAKGKEPEGQKVDSGSFGVFINGQRVGTETFSITQNPNGSVIRSEFKAEGAAGPAAQSSELQLTAGGEIRRYDWKELSPGKGQSTVVPNDQFLSQKWSAGPQDKPQEQPYLLPSSTSILDDYFFVHREVLVWKYLASACKQEKGQVQCPVKQRAQFGTMNPRQHSSASATMEYVGREKVNVRGSEQELNKLELKSDTGNWQLWVDDQFKLLRISIPSENTEVVRD
jgi:hypothetical protein